MNVLYFFASRLVIASLLLSLLLPRFDLDPHVMVLMRSILLFLSLIITLNSLSPPPSPPLSPRPTPSIPPHHTAASARSALDSWAQSSSSPPTLTRTIPPLIPSTKLDKYSPTVPQFASHLGSTNAANLAARRGHLLLTGAKFAVSRQVQPCDVLTLALPSSRRTTNPSQLGTSDSVLRGEGDADKFSNKGSWDSSVAGRAPRCSRKAGRLHNAVVDGNLKRGSELCLDDILPLILTPSKEKTGCQRRCRGIGWTSEWRVQLWCRRQGHPTCSLGASLRRGDRTRSTAPLLWGR